MARKKGFWEKFDDLMDGLGDHIEEQVDKIESGSNSITSIGSGNKVTQRSVFGSSTSTIVQNGKKIVIQTKNGKLTIKVNGKEYVPKDKK